VKRNIPTVGRSAVYQPGILEATRTEPSASHGSRRKVMLKLFSMLLLLSSAPFLFPQSLAQHQSAPTLSPQAEAHVMATATFSVSHSRRTVKARLLACDALDPQAKQPPKVVEYERWTNAANTTIWRLPIEAVGCYYDIGSTIVKVTQP
jgi:hypothetical protein